MKKYYYVGWHTSSSARNDDRFLVNDCIEFTDEKEADAYMEAEKAKYGWNRYYVCCECWSRVSYKGQYNNNRREG